MGNASVSAGAHAIVPLAKMAPVAAVYLGNELVGLATYNLFPVFLLKSLYRYYKYQRTTRMHLTMSNHLFTV